MRHTLLESWALFLGMLLLMVSNGLLVTLLTVRGSTLGFSGLEISVMQACYPLGALAGTILTPKLIEKVGHIRVFSALGSLVSVAAILHLLTDDPISWSLMRLLTGFCFPGLYVITESWLNAKTVNRVRAQVLSIYFIIQTAGPALGTAMVSLPDPGGNLLFGLTSIMLSVAIVPLLLSNNRAPEYSVPERMPIGKLYRVSPMAVLGILIMAATVGAWFITLPLYVLNQGFSEAEASFTLVVAMIAAATVQYPIGWIADQVDRRLVVIGLSGIAVLAAIWMIVDSNPLNIIIGFAIISASTMPVYSILAAHANDHLNPGQVVAASGSMAFLSQLGQFIGILIGPNVMAFADGRGLQASISILSGLVVVIALTRKVTTEAPSETGEVHATGVIGVAQPGMLQAELSDEVIEHSEADAAENPTSDQQSS